MFIFACSLAFMLDMLAFALLFAVPTFALAGVAVTLALPFVFELSVVVHAAQKAVTESKRRKAIVRRIEVPPV